MSLLAMKSDDKIYSLDLIYEGEPVPFVIKTMEEIDLALGGIADKPHKHNYYTVIWPVNATGKHIIDFREYPIRPNHLFFVSPGQVHQVITDPGPTGFVIVFSPEFLEMNSIRKDFIADLRIFRKSDETPPLPLTGSMARNLTLFSRQMMVEFRNRKEMYLEKIGAYLKLFLIECNSQCSLHPTAEPPYIDSGKTLIRNFRETVEQHFHTWHQVKEYAEALFVTPNYLNEAIRSSMDISAKEYIQNRLVLEAKRLAIFTEKSNKEIGYDLGFEDPGHFSKFFKKQTGKSLQDFKLMGR
jgi:AraC family transcriptional regulator, transcriptional activator of pobA